MILHGFQKIWILSSSGKNISRVERSETSEMFGHEKIKFISFGNRVMFFLLYGRRTSFYDFLKFLKNLWKSSEVFVKLRKRFKSNF